MVTRVELHHIIAFNCSRPTWYCCSTPGVVRANYKKDINMRWKPNIQRWIMWLWKVDRQEHYECLLEPDVQWSTWDIIYATLPEFVLIYWGRLQKCSFRTVGNRTNIWTWEFPHTN